MKTPVTVLSDMLRAIRDAEHAQRISETTERARRKADLLRGSLTSGNKKQTETGLNMMLMFWQNVILINIKTK